MVKANGGLSNVVANALSKQGISVYPTGFDRSIQAPGVRQGIGFCSASRICYPWSAMANVHSSI
jgi:hypothetical protein